MAEAVYVSASNVVSATYGEDRLILSLDLREGERAYLNNRALADFKTEHYSEEDHDPALMA